MTARITGRGIVRFRPPGYIVAAFFAAFLVYGAVLAISRIYPFGPKSVLMYDMGNQYSQFHAYYQQVLQGRASLAFTWRSDLGMNFLPLFAYYLASPFSLIVGIVPERYIPEAMVLIILLKTGTGSAAMAAYLRRMSPAGSKRLAAAFAVPYAVSAWTVSYSFNIMWLDVLYLLPLLLIAAEALLARGRMFPLAAVCAASALINYYMFGIMVPFLVCYLAIRYIAVEPALRRAGPVRFTVKAALTIGIGIGSAGVLLLPTAYGLLNGRTNILGQDPIPVPLQWSVQGARLFGGTFDWFQGSPNLAGGTVILIAASLFPFLRRFPRRERLGFLALFVLLMAASQNQVAYLIFHDGERPNAFPFRYGFLVPALLVMLGYRAVSEFKAVDAARTVKVLWRVTLFWFAMVFIVADSAPGLMTPRLAVTAVLMVALGAIGIGFLVGLRSGSRRVAARVTALVAVLLVVDTGFAAGQESSAMLYPQRGAWNVHPTKDWTAAMKATAPPAGQFYRADGVWTNFLNGLQRSQNESLRDGNFGQNHFSSLSSGRLHDALFSLGFTEHIYRVWAGHTGSTLLTDALFDFRYLVSPDVLDRADTKLVQAWPTARVYENTATLPVGFLAPTTLPDGLNQKDPFTAQEELFGMPGAFAQPCQAEPDVSGAMKDKAPNGEDMFLKQSGVKQVTLTWHCHANGEQQLYAWAKDMPWAGQYPGSGIFNLQVDADQPVDYPNVYDNGIHDMGTRTDTDFTVTLTTKLGQFNVPHGFIRALDVHAVNAKVAELAQHGLYAVHATDTGLSGQIDADRAGTVFMSVPAIQGWGTVLVDGRPVTTRTVASSFIGIPVTAGHHTISMEFSPPGLRLGGAMTAFGVLLMFGLYRRDRRGERRRAALAKAAAVLTPQGAEAVVANVVAAAVPGSDTPMVPAQREPEPDPEPVAETAGTAGTAVETSLPADAPADREAGGEIDPASIAVEADGPSTTGALK